MLSVVLLLVLGVGTGPAICVNAKTRGCAYRDSFDSCERRLNHSDCDLTSTPHKAFHEKALSRQGQRGGL